MINQNKIWIIIFIILFCIFGFCFLNKDYVNSLGTGTYISSSRLIGEKVPIEEGVGNSKKELNILFAGDIMLDRSIRKKINEYGSIQSFVNIFLNNLSAKNQEYDYVVANLEGPITENKSKTLNPDGSYNNILLFTFTTSTSQILNLLNIKVVSLANNHTDNFYNSGFQDTKKFLQEGAIEYFGNPYNYNQKESLSNTVCDNDICIAYIGYHQFTSQNDSQRIENEIKKLKQNEKTDFIVVMPHWGVEYATKSSQNQKNLARGWIDAGADMVIGAHSHVIEESEIYKGKYIYYSLGNYIFDQWFSEDVKNGLAVNFRFKKEILENGQIKREIEFVEEVKIRSEKTGIKYIFE